MTTILVVEDNLTLLEDIAFELESRGYSVIQAVNGRCALDRLQSVQRLPDIIVSDIAMPVMDGFTLLDRVKQDAAWRSIPFLFLTAFNARDSVRIAQELGADDYLVKPFKGDELVEAIEQKLARHQSASSGA